MSKGYSIRLISKNIIVKDWGEGKIPDGILAMGPTESAIAVTVMPNSEADRKLNAVEARHLVDEEGTPVLNSDLTSKTIGDTKLGELPFRDDNGIPFKIRFFEARPDTMAEITTALGMNYRKTEKYVGLLTNGSSSHVR